jgi:hypothetical protein
MRREASVPNSKGSVLVRAGDVAVDISEWEIVDPGEGRNRHRPSTQDVQHPFLNPIYQQILGADTWTVPKGEENHRDVPIFGPS